MKEKQLYVIPQEIIDDLSNIQAYDCSDKVTTPEEYILEYMTADCPATYYKDGRQQCKKHANRSFLDLYFLTKAKFPEFTLEEMATLFLSLNGRIIYDNVGLLVYFCTTIRKPVIYNQNFTGSFDICIGKKDWIDAFINTRSADITMKQIFDLAGLDYYHFVKKD